MAVLSIRNLPDDVHARLRIRAARAGHSMEAEARKILAEACKADALVLPAATLQDLVDDLYGSARPQDVVASLISERRREAADE